MKILIGAAVVFLLLVAIIAIIGYVRSKGKSRKAARQDKARREFYQQLNQR